jgi:pentatricopeptide repeat protein
MQRAQLLFFVCCFFVFIALPDVHAQALGETTFTNSGSEEAQDAFLRGILLLHSFEYEDAREAFQEAQDIDPDFAMAYWGEAMGHNHPVWMRQDANDAREVLKELGPTPEERLAKTPTEREKDYLRAADILFGEGEKEDRDDAFAEAMQRLHERYPDDLNAAAFYALALLGTSHEGRDVATYMRAASIAEEVFASNPKHHGAAHYLIHSYDDPVHAPLGLRAARVYAQIAPSATHALHMPSHIFVALGMWDDVVASNEDSWAASDERVQAKNLSVNQRSYHALSWLMYGYLQQGRYRDAHAMLDTMRSDHQADESGGTRYYLTAMRAAYVVGTEDWDGDAMEIEIDSDALDLEAAATNLFVIGMAALETGRRADALDDLDAPGAEHEAHAHEGEGEHHPPAPSGPAEHP